MFYGRHSVFCRLWLNSMTFTHTAFLTHTNHATQAKVSTHATHAKILWTHATHTTHATHAPTLPTPPTNPRHSRNLADSHYCDKVWFILKNATQVCSLFSIRISQILMFKPKSVSLYVVVNTHACQDLQKMF